MDDLIAVAKRRTNDTYLIDAVSNEQLTTEDFLRRSYSLAAELQHLGCKKNTVVGILSENRLEYSIVTLGSVTIGATLTCLNPYHTVGELKSTFNITKPTLMFCSAENYDKVTQIVPIATKIIVFDSQDEALNESSCLSFSLLTHQSTKTFIAAKNKPDDVALILYSSGTTGLPKGVMLTHRNVIFILKFSQLAELKMPLGKDEHFKVQVTVSPMFHASGLTYIFSALARNMTLVIMQQFEPRLLLSTIEGYKIKHISLIPASIIYLLKSAITHEYDLSSLQSALYGAGALKYETEQAFKQKFLLDGVLQLYGLTESTCMATLRDRSNTKPDTVGSVLPGCQMKVVHIQTGEILGNNEAGEIRIKGPHVMKGYYGNEQATADAFDEDGWLRTGDFGYYDADGDFFIMNRIKDFIKYKSSQVAPVELETLLLTHPAIVDCAVIGIPNEDAGELSRAYVVKRAGFEVTEDEIIQFMAEVYVLENGPVPSNR